MPEINGTEYQACEDIPPTMNIREALHAKLDELMDIISNSGKGARFVITSDLQPDMLLRMSLHVANITDQDCVFCEGVGMIPGEVEGNG